MKKILLIVLMTFIISGCTLFNDTNKENLETGEKVLTITDISKNCFSNALVVYDNSTYEVVKGAYSENEDPILHRGTYHYDIDSLIPLIKEYPRDNEHYMNYEVTIHNDDSYIVDMTQAVELNDFINSLDNLLLF